jgi:hypothetical protein
MNLFTSAQFKMFGVVLAVLFATNSTFAQTTSFSYQGKLTDGGNPASGTYDLQFALFDSLSGGSQIGSTVTLAATVVTGGIFTVQLDFGNAFPGANRFLEQSVRPAGGGTFTLLTPRQRITSTPYSIRSATTANADNATQLGGVVASQYVQTNDSRLSDPRPPTPSSSNYIQNATSQQANTNFNISGNGVINGRIGVGTNAPLSKLDVRGNVTIGLPAFAPIFGINALFVANDDGGDPNNYFRIDGSGDTLYIVASSQPGASRGARLILRTGAAGMAEADRITIDESGNVGISGLVAVNLASGNTALCHNGFGVLSSCSSSLRYKTAIQPFQSGLSLVRSLHPVTFNWKSDGSRDLGLIAEEVAAVEPRLVTHNQKGEIEGVKYDRLTAVLINASKEQQALIELHQKQIAIQQSMIEKLRTRVSALEKLQQRKGK